MRHANLADLILPCRQAELLDSNHGQQQVDFWVRYTRQPSYPQWCRRKTTFFFTRQRTVVVSRLVVGLVYGRLVAKTSLEQYVRHWSSVFFFSLAPTTTSTTVYCTVLTQRLVLLLLFFSTFCCKQPITREVLQVHLRLPEWNKNRLKGTVSRELRWVLVYFDQKLFSWANVAH